MMPEKCSYCGEEGHSIQECPKWKAKVASAKEEVTPYMREKIPLIMSRLREAQKTMMVSKEILYEWLHPYITKAAFEEIISYLLRKGEIFEPRPGFLKTTESSSSTITTAVLTDEVKRNIRESLCYSVAANIRILRADLIMTTARLIVSDFYASLNRKHILTNMETELEIDVAYTLLKELLG